MANAFFQSVAKRYRTYERAYRALVAGSNDAQNRSKRAIFSFQRSDLAAGSALLEEAAAILKSFQADFKKEPMLRFEGAYRAALEEHIEASLFAQFLRRKPLGAVAIPDLDAELYLGGLSDLTGELVRYAVARATAHDEKEVTRARKTLDEVMAFLNELDLTGYLRQKFDQAKNSLRRMEEIAYDLAMRKR